MDKYEYKVRAEEIKALIAEGEFAEAVKIADTIDWHRVKSVMMLCTISDLYKINRRFQESKDILLMAYERHPGGRLIVYSLCELSIKMGEFVQAIEYYKEFVQIAPKDTGRYILQYKLYEAQDVSLEERIAVLEEFKKRDYREKWAYELAYLYHRVGLETKCIEECDEMILWFGEGRYVMKALELKQLHQPLNEFQQEKYLLMKQGVEMLTEESKENEELPEEQPENLAEESETYGRIENGKAGYAEEVSEYSQPEEEEDFKVKTVDLGQYNTINLQKELAESMKEILGNEREEESENVSMGPITESIVAPLLQETGDLSQDILNIPFNMSQNTPRIKDIEFVELEEEEAAVSEHPAGKAQAPDSRIATEEVFFEEDIKDILLEDTKRINMGDTKEIAPKRKVIYPTTMPSRLAMTQQTTPPYHAAGGPTAANGVPVQESSAISNAVQEQEAVQAPEASAATLQIPETIQAQPSLMKKHKPSGFEQMLSQEYDGQISLVVPNRSDVEKQITGQMNISDIMAEWERMKRENEEKRREDVRKRVQQHTGSMFSEFDEATKSGLLEQLEKAVVEAILKESGQKSMNPNEITEQQLTDIVKSVGRKKEVPGTAMFQEENEQENIADVPDIRDDMREISRADEIKEPDEMEEAQILSEEVLPSIDEIKELPGRKEIAEGAGAAQIADADGMPSEAEAPKAVETLGQKEKAGILEEHKNRSLSKEEKDLFGRFAHNRKSKEQIIHAIDEMSMDSYSGNVIVTGEEEAGTLDLAKNLVRMLQLSDRNFSGKAAKISGDTLNKKDVQDTLEKLIDGALIIEHATDMSSGTAADLNKALGKENRGIFVIMEGKRDEMNIFLRKNYALMDNFNARIDIESLDDHSLVEYAKQYAEEMEYSIDELGILALHTRIADMQTSDHEVTVAEVKELVDDAIYFADRKNPKHFFDILFGKRYDEEDMIILREKDFMHY